MQNVIMILHAAYDHNFTSYPAYNVTIPSKITQGSGLRLEVLQ